MKKRLVILEFGGTIAMAPNTNGALAPAKSIKTILGNLPGLHELAEISIVPLLNCDSSNIHPENWIKLGHHITQVAATCDAVIVTHGTDTMAYAAGAVSLALGQGLQIPVIFTGSQRSMMENGSDGLINLEHSIETAVKASELGIAEVMIVFGHRVLRASRAVKITESGFLAFDSPAHSDLASLTALGISFTSEARRADPSKKFEPTFEFNPNIISIGVVPGLNPKLISTIIHSNICDGLVLRAHGAGNVPSEGKYSLIPVITEATQELGIPVLIATKFVGGRVRLDSYEPGRLAHSAGAISTGDLSSIMAEVKLMWALGQGYKSGKELAKIINTDLIGELTPDPFR